MPLATGQAPGKIILFGEHAVVYGQPALAIPLHGLKSSAEATPGEPGQGIVIHAVDLNQQLTLKNAAQDALASAAQLLLDKLDLPEPDVTLTIRSVIPIASGLGSGASVSTALVRALASFLGKPLPPDQLSPLIFEVEKIFHGTPSGIDNTVVAYGQPVYFQRRESGPPRIEPFSPVAPLHLLVADTGVASPTKITVGDVRQGWQANPAPYEAIFEQIGALVRQARQAIESGEVGILGLLMQHNQALLRELDVSSPEIEALITAALQAGASGAKLSGGGRGGNIIALLEENTAPEISRALQAAGAKRVLTTSLIPAGDLPT